jgi:S1-C subfamily serine protease
VVGGDRSTDIAVVRVDRDGLPAADFAENLSLRAGELAVADQLIEDGEADHPYLGVSLTNLTPQIAEQFGISAESGVLVTDVDPKGPAAEAGIEPGNVLTALGSQGVADTGDLLAALREYGPGDTVELAVAAEAGETREVSVELGERG